MADDGPGLRKLFALEGDARRTVSLVVLGLAVLVLVAAISLFLLRGGQDRSTFLGLIVVVLVLGAAQAYLIFGGRAAQAKEGRHVEEYLLADEAPVLHEDLYEIKCGQCGTQFRVADTLQRPLLAHCPVCGAEGIVPVRGATPPAVPPAVPSATPPPTGTSPVRAVRLKCPRCQAVTSVADTGARPLRARCSGCGAALGLR